MVIKIHVAVVIYCLTDRLLWSQVALGIREYFIFLKVFLKCQAHKALNIYRQGLSSLCLLYCVMQCLIYEYIRYHTSSLFHFSFTYICCLMFSILLLILFLYLFYIVFIYQYSEPHTSVYSISYVFCNVVFVLCIQIHAVHFDSCFNIELRKRQLFYFLFHQQYSIYSLF